MRREPQASGLQAGGLHLPRDIGVSTTEAQAIETRWNTIDKVDARLQQQGIHTNNQPDVTCPDVTAEALMHPDINEYTRVFAAQLRWYNYVTRLLADVRAVLLQIGNEMDDIERAKRTHFRSLNEGRGRTDKVSVVEMEDLIGQDPTYRSLKLQKQELDQQRIKLDAWGDSLDRNLKTVSRQIENRKTESIGGNREGNMPGHGAGRWENNHMKNVR